MARYRSYRATSKTAVTVGAAAEAAAPFSIDVRFVGGLTPTEEQAFKTAADRWCRLIVGDLPPIIADGEVVDDLLILAQGDIIDGPGHILGQAGPLLLRPRSAGRSALLPAKGVMTFDSADLLLMEQAGTLLDVITHEMGHVLGIGTIWGRKNLIKGLGTANPTFVGPAAMAEYGRLRGSEPMPVPVENTGGPGTAGCHWRETIFRHEMMSGFISAAANPLSRVTVASLQDLGYSVDLGAAEPYRLPNLLALAESGELIPHRAPIGAGTMLPLIPMVLPDDSLL
jgi:leishmanolysin